MTRAEKAGLKAYPENISYSTLYNTMMDFNAEKRRVFIEGYERGCKDTIDHPSGGGLLHVLNKGVEQGYKDATNKALEWIEKFAYNSIVTDNIGEREKQAIIIAFKEYMEENQ